ncbi:MAG: hypothetical protein COB02_07730 [Candidatus Cloacimonadota bacterium]|nr:MAG: hypothetical protein COB02_07730 [Candidatus Cloacimonadota bacterium]
MVKKCLILCFLIISIISSKGFETEIVKTSYNAGLSAADIRGKYKLEDLLDGADILFDNKEYRRAQDLYELSLSLDAKNLSIFKHLSIIYEKTEQTIKLAHLAESVASYLLPKGKNDDFYQKMLTISISLNSKRNIELAWKTWGRLFTTVKKKPGELRNIVKTLEHRVHVPFLARMYRLLEKRKLYNEYKWGQVAEYYFLQGERNKARFYYEKEFKKRIFDRRYLYPYALIEYEDRNFQSCQVFIKLAKSLVKDSLILRKVELLQRNLDEHLYDVGADQIRKEVDFLFKFDEPKLALRRLEELTLLSLNHPQTYLDIAKFLFKYPKKYKTWDYAKNYLIKFSAFKSLSFEDLLSACEMFYEKNLLEEMVVLLKKVEVKFSKRAKKNKRLKLFKAQVLEQLKQDIKLFDLHGSTLELKRYLEFVLAFDPYFAEAYIKLSELYVLEIEKEIKSRKSLSKQLREEVYDFIIRMKENPLRRSLLRSDLNYFSAKLMIYFPKKYRKHSSEISYLKSALREDDTLLDAYLMLAKVYYDFEFYRQSVKSLLTLKSKLDEDEFDLMKTINALLSKNHRKLASQSYAHSNYFLVVNSMEKSLLYVKKDTIDRESSIWLAYSYYYVEQFKKMEKLVNTSITTYGKDTELYYLLALSYEGKYEYKNAVDAYKKALKINKNEKSPFIEECEKSIVTLEAILESRKQ